MPKVFRIEHQDTHIGPFQTCAELTERLARLLNSRPELPYPGDDGLGLANIPWTFVFGCLTIDTLKKWVLLGETQEENEMIVQELVTLGFVLAEFDVPLHEIRRGRSGNQVAFYADDNREEGLVRNHPLKRLLAHDELEIA